MPLYTYIFTPISLYLYTFIPSDPRPSYTYTIIPIIFPKVYLAYPSTFLPFYPCSLLVCKSATLVHSYPTTPSFVPFITLNEEPIMHQAQQRY